jgi:hypothetical protein
MPIGRPDNGGAMLTRKPARRVRPVGSAITAARGEYLENISVTSGRYISAAHQSPDRTAFSDALGKSQPNSQEIRSHQKLTLRTPYVNRTFTRGYLSRLRLVRVAMV